MSRNNAQLFELADELSIILLTGGGAYDLIGSFLFPPAMVIFDNQGVVTVEIGNNGTSTWKTFVAGEALVLDLRGQKANASNGAFRQGMPLFATGAAGACDFKISYVYPKAN